MNIYREIRAHLDDSRALRELLRLRNPLHTHDLRLMRALHDDEYAELMIECALGARWLAFEALREHLWLACGTWRNLEACCTPLYTRAAQLSDNAWLLAQLHDRVPVDVLEVILETEDDEAWLRRALSGLPRVSRDDWKRVMAYTSGKLPLSAQRVVRAHMSGNKR